jgi:metallo-beta-lactamase class B
MAEESGQQMKWTKISYLGAVPAAALLVLSSCAQLADPAEFLEPFPAHHVIANIYYVGTQGQANYLITTPEGNILINSGLEENPPMIRASIEKLGFKYSDTKILLISHAHGDHDAGSAEVIKETGAMYEVMDSDVPVVESGGKLDFEYDGESGENLYPATKVDRVLHDGDTVSLGGTALTAHKTPGHTKGCTTWTMQVQEGGKILNMTFVGSAALHSGLSLIGNKKYPDIVQDYEETFRVLHALPTDVFLGAHGGYYRMNSKYKKLEAGAPNPFIDPDGYEAYVADQEAAFRRELARQQAGGKRG